ncbi:MAG TPA: UbiA family prenyltransferase [Isosphaeraceae bacterium]|nr:UbiA family prenyltransferase [Isosphaeraceae bacterium]
MRLKPYLQLVRLPNLFTAAADPLAGWLLVRGSFDEPLHWLPLCAASVAIYAGGVALNDYFDYDIDLAERPRRPLPSGQVPRQFAAWLGGGLLAAGLALAVLSGSGASLIVAVLLVTCVLAYDAALKATHLGPLLMGTCRGLNLLLGMSQTPGLGHPVGWLAAGSLALFVAGITWISRSEAGEGQKGGIFAGLVIQNAAAVGLLAAAVSGKRFPNPSASAPILPLEGLAVLAFVFLLVNLAGTRALRDPVPERVQQAVKTGVLALVWIDVGLVAAVRGPVPALAVAALWVPAFVLARWLYAT